VEISLLIEMFRARVVDVSAGDMMIEISGQESKIEAFIDLMRPYGSWNWRDRTDCPVRAAPRAHGTCFEPTGHETRRPSHLSRPQKKCWARLQPGQRIRITQRVKVGSKIWTTTVHGVFRHLSSLVTGLATQRVEADDIVVPTVPFTKDNGELTSIALDENSKVEIVT